MQGIREKDRSEDTQRVKPAAPETIEMPQVMLNMSIDATLLKSAINDESYPECFKTLKHLEPADAE
jgi:hypothetical protein